MDNLSNNSSGGRSSNNRLLMFAAIAAGIVLLIVAAIYLTQPASSLPFFFPGHAAAPTTLIHFKHGVAAGLLGLGALVLAWFASAPSSANQK